MQYIKHQKNNSYNNLYNISQKKKSVSPFHCQNDCKNNQGQTQREKKFFSTICTTCARLRQYSQEKNLQKNSIADPLHPKGSQTERYKTPSTTRQTQNFDPKLSNSSQFDSEKIYLSQIYNKSALKTTRIPSAGKQDNSSYISSLSRENLMTMKKNSEATYEKCYRKIRKAYKSLDQIKNLLQKTHSFTQIDSDNNIQQSPLPQQQQDPKSSMIYQGKTVPKREKLLNNNEDFQMTQKYNNYYNTNTSGDQSFNTQSNPTIKKTQALQKPLYDVKDFTLEKSLSPKHAQKTNTNYLKKRSQEEDKFQKPFSQSVNILPGKSGIKYNPFKLKSKQVSESFNKENLLPQSKSSIYQKIQQNLTKTPQNTLQQQQQNNTGQQQKTPNNPIFQKVPDPLKQDSESELSFSFEYLEEPENNGSNSNKKIKLRTKNPQIKKHIYKIMDKIQQNNSNNLNQN